MPEGDTIYRTAGALRAALEGHDVTRFETDYPQLLSRGSLVGSKVLSVSSQGKWILVRLSGDLVLLTHLRMHGSWRIHPSSRPCRAIAPGILLGTSRAVATGNRIPVAELLTGDRLSRHPVLARLGPDPLSPSFDPGEVLRRLRAHNSEPMGKLLLDQGVIAGLGNVFKSEVLFRAGVHPLRKASEFPDEVLLGVVHDAAALLRRNAERTSRSTTFRMDPAASLYVYDRAGEPCRRCGRGVSALRLNGERTSYLCEGCQPR